MIVMNAGIAEQIGTPLEVYETPRTLFAAQFIGSPAMNILDAHVRDGWVTLGDTRIVKSVGPDGPIKFGIRPEHLIADEAGPIHVNAKMAEPLGANTLLHCALCGTQEAFTASLPGVHILSGTDTTWRFSIDPAKAHLFDMKTGLRRVG